MRKTLVQFFILPVILLTGCSTSSQFEIQKIDITTENKNIPDSILNVFSGVWARNDGDYNTYFKIRQDSIEFQSSKEFYNYYDIIKDITYDDTGKNIYLTTINNCDYNEKSEGSTIHIELIDSETIKLEGKVLSRVFNIEKAVNELAPIFELNKISNPEYNLGLFLDITSDDLKIMLDNKC